MYWKGIIVCGKCEPSFIEGLKCTVCSHCGSGRTSFVCHCLWEAPMLMLFVAITYCHLATVCWHWKTKCVQQQIPYSSVNSWQNPLFNHVSKELSDQCQLCCCPPLVETFLSSTIDRLWVQVVLFLDRSGIIPTGHRKASVRIVTLWVSSFFVVKRFRCRELDWESSRSYITSLLHPGFQKARKQTCCSSSAIVHSFGRLTRIIVGIFVGRCVGSTEFFLHACCRN